MDAVIWVFDPVKYNDPTLHDDFLSPLAAYERQFLFVLNKADLLQKADVEDVNALELVTEDLTIKLTDDGFLDPDPLVVAADPPVGPPAGIDAVRDALDERLASKHAASAKIVEDMAMTSWRVSRSISSMRAGSKAAFSRMVRAASAGISPRSASTSQTAISTSSQR